MPGAFGAIDWIAHTMHGTNIFYLEDRYGA